MEKGFRILVAGWIVVLGLVTAGLASYNDHLDSLPGTLIRCLPDCYHLALCVPLLVLLAPARTLQATGLAVDYMSPLFCR